MQEIIYALDKLSNTLTLAKDDSGYKLELFLMYRDSCEELFSDIDKLAELMWLLRTNQVEIKEVAPDTIPFDDIPEEWLDRCSGEGHDRTTDEAGNKVYVDSGNIVQEEGWRPCAKCGEFPTDEGHDHCIQNLGSVINACCGHGKNKGYIMFDDGRLIEGDFTVTNLWEGSDGEE